MRDTRSAKHQPLASQCKPAAVPDAALLHRLAHPSPEALAARVALMQERGAQVRYREIRRIQSELRKMRERLAALHANQFELAQLFEVAKDAAPNKTDQAAWPSDVQELADKIERESVRDLWPTEAPVRDKDRQKVVKMFPAGIEAAKDDPAPLALAK